MFSSERQKPLVNVSIREPDSRIRNILSMPSKSLFLVLYAQEVLPHLPVTRYNLEPNHVKWVNTSWTYSSFELLYFQLNVKNLELSYTRA